MLYTAKKYYTRAKHSEVFPNNKDYYQNNLPLKKQKRVVLFGDSRIEMWKNLPDLKGFEFINRGISRETTAWSRKRFEKDVLELKPDIVILQTGGNDVNLLGVQPHLKQAVIQQCQDNLKFFVESLQAQEIEVIFLTIIQISKLEILRRLVWDEKVSHSIEEINQYWLNLPKTELLHVINTEKVLKNSQGQWHKNVNLDSLHLTATGYDYLNQAITPVLKNLTI
ncbi:GDSL-type esterase/lipase family protein [Candidatus Halobeggiatoa sp. HSG11]|nr:GDSL-type esterase/lipase family protein [Candidatus Halobeggiatoa sp. HSG11]